MCKRERRPAHWQILIPLASYVLTNGVLQYVGAVVIAIAIAAACTAQADSVENEEPATNSLACQLFAVR